MLTKEKLRYLWFLVNVILLYRSINYSKLDLRYISAIKKSRIYWKLKILKQEKIKNYINIYNDQKKEISICIKNINIGPLRIGKQYIVW